jgi:hypothetical protein
VSDSNEIYSGAFTLSSSATILRVDDELRTWLRANRHERALASGRVDQLDAELTTKVKRAIDGKIATAAEIAETLGVSRARVYQIRDGRR